MKILFREIYKDTSSFQHKTSTTMNIWKYLTLFFACAAIISIAATRYESYNLGESKPENVTPVYRLHAVLTDSQRKEVIALLQNFHASQSGPSLQIAGEDRTVLTDSQRNEVIALVQKHRTTSREINHHQTLERLVRGTPQFGGPCDYADVENAGVAPCRSFMLTYGTGLTKRQVKTKSKYFFVRTATVPSFLISGNSFPEMFNPKAIEKNIVMSEQIWMNGGYDIQKLSIVGNLLRFRKTSRVFDFGANVGLFGLYAAAMGHQVDALEPALMNQQNIERSIKANAFEKYNLHKVAVGNKKSQFIVDCGGHVDGNCQTRNVKDDEKDSDLVVRVETISTFLEKEKFKKDDVYFMKFDVEGHELEAVQGGTFAFENAKVPYLIFEWSVHHQDQIKAGSAVALFEFLIDHGYVVEMLDYPTVTEKSQIPHIYNSVKASSGHPDLYASRKGLCPWFAPPVCFRDQHRKDNMFYMPRHFDETVHQAFYSASLRNKN